MQAFAAVLVALSLTQAAPATPAAQASKTGSIAGTVTVEGANTPVPGARIVLFPGTPPIGPFGMLPQAITGQDGRFIFDNLAPGAYRMDVQKPGFAPMNEPGRARSAQVNAGQTTRIDLQLQRGGVIAGKLLDASGEPLAEMQIMPMRRMDLNGPGAGPRLVPAGPGQQTNDLGEFRLAGLASGEYYVAAMPRGGSPFGGSAVMPTANATATTTTFYPGTSDEAAAHTVRVGAGQTVNDVVFTMQAVPAFRVSGRVVDESGAPVSGAMVTLMADPRANRFMGPHGNARTGDDGRFTIAEVPSGSYRVTASVPVMINGTGAIATGGVGGGAVAGVVGGVVGGVVVSGGSAGSGTFTSWSSAGVTSAMIGAADPPTEITVNGADVTGVRVVTRRTTPQP